MSRSVEHAISAGALLNTRRLGRMLLRALTIVVMIVLSVHAMADPPIWANAKRVKATLAQCGEQRSILFKGDSFKAPVLRNPAGCTSVEVFYTQLNVFKAYFSPKDGSFAEANVDAAYLTCGGEAASGGQRGVLILGTAGAIKRAMREHPAPRGCTYRTEKYQYVSSAGSIPFTDVANGGTMSVAESLRIHAEERKQAIAVCNASPACQAEVRRQSAINSYYDCMKPLQRGEAPRTCYRPW